MKLKLFLIAATLAISACAGGLDGPTTGPKTPAQAVFIAKTGYSSALTAALAYKRLPVCATPARQPCSDPVVVSQLQKADDVAAGALDAAEVAVRTPGFGGDIVASAIAAANAALAALVSITTSL